MLGVPYAVTWSSSSHDTKVMMYDFCVLSGLRYIASFIVLHRSARAHLHVDVLKHALLVVIVEVLFLAIHRSYKKAYKDMPYTSYRLPILVRFMRIACLSSSWMYQSHCLSRCRASYPYLSPDSRPLPCPSDHLADMSDS